MLGVKEDVGMSVASKISVTNASIKFGNGSINTFNFPKSQCIKKRKVALYVSLQNITHETLLA